MSQSKHSYVLSGAATAAEVKRLRQIDDLVKPTTERRIEQLGIAEGWKCLEVGAGVGGVARWMADRVGPSGKITAIDLTPLFDADPNLPQLEIRRHDILAEGLEADFYDLVHCRLMLANVGNVELALTRMVQALRPGGWLIVEEPGESRYPGVGESNPKVEEFNRLAESFLKSVQEHVKAIEIDIFRRLPGLLEDLGLVGIRGDLTYPLVGSQGRAALLGTLQAIRPMLAETPFVKEGEIERLTELCLDPTLLTMGGSTLGLWGQRPAPGIPS